MRGFVLTVCLAALAAAVFACATEPAEDAEQESARTEVPSLEPTFESAEALARSVVDAFARGDGEALQSFALTKEQFRYYVWPELPSSRPERGVPFEYGWGDLNQKSRNSLLRSFDRYKELPLEFLELAFEEETTDYRTYLVHRDARVKVRREDGREVWIDLFGSVMEIDGRFKLFSYVTD